jgi:apolipoprotein D and lipocalin family protein
MGRGAAMAATIAPLAKRIDPLKCMGDWYVQVAIPTPFDRGAHNGLEQYTWNEQKQRVKVKYTFNNKSFTGKLTEVTQVGRVAPKSENGTTWQVAPWLGFMYTPFWLDYIIIDVDEDYSYMVCSSPSTGGLAPWMYIMTRQKVVTDESLEPLKATAVKAGWDAAKMERVPHQETSQVAGG